MICSSSCMPYLNFAIFSRMQQKLTLVRSMHSHPKSKVSNNSITIPWYIFEWRVPRIKIFHLLLTLLRHTQELICQKYSRKQLVELGSSSGKAYKQPVLTIISFSGSFGLWPILYITCYWVLFYQTINYCMAWVVSLFVNRTTQYYASQ